jgi:hypothetical protein
MIPGIMVVHMVLHIIKFVNGFPCQGGVKHFLPGYITVDCHLHQSNIVLSFGVYCQVAENVEPQNNLAPRTRAANLLGSSGKLSSDQVFLDLDTGYTVIRHQWVALLMPPAVIDCVNLLGWHEPAILTFADLQGHDIGDSNPQDSNSFGVLDDDSVIIYPAIEIPGVDETTDPAEIAGVNPDFIVKPTEVDMDTNAWAMDTNVPVDNNAIATDGLKQQDPTDGATAVPNLSQPLAQRRLEAQSRRLHHPGWGRQHKTLGLRNYLRSMPLV